MRCNYCVHNRLSRRRCATGRYVLRNILHDWIDSLSSSSVDACYHACDEAERQRFEIFHKLLRGLNILNASLLQLFDSAILDCFEIGFGIIHCESPRAKLLESFLIAEWQMILALTSSTISANVSLGNRLMTYIDRSKSHENHDQVDFARLL